MADGNDIAFHRIANGECLVLIYACILLLILADTIYATLVGITKVRVVARNKLFRAIAGCSVTIRTWKKNEKHAC